MAEEKILGVKTTEKETVATTHQVEEKTPDFVNEIDSVLKENEEGEKDFNPETTDYDDDSVVISKTDLDTFKKSLKAGKNYKTGLLSIKQKIKDSKKVVSKKIPEVEENKKEDIDKFDKFIQNSAIDEACKNIEIEQHWAEIMPYYVVRRDKNTVGNIVKDINDAYTLYLKDNPEADNIEDRDVVTNLSTEKTKIKEGTKQGGTEKKRKTILKKTQPVSEWY